MVQKIKFYKSELRFSTSMAYEIVRKELQKRFGSAAMFTYVDFSATQLEKINKESKTCTDKEAGQLFASTERYVAINGMVVVENEPEKVFVIVAQLRLFKLDVSLIWEPHYLTLEVINEKINKKLITYYDGLIDGSKIFQNSLNLCSSLLHTQTQQYVERVGKI